MLKEVASALRKSERWLWDWLKKRTHGLVWLLQRRRAAELIKGRAVIETAYSTVAYRPYSKPALGPLGDSLDDFAPGAEAGAPDVPTCWRNE
jgi:hypothetical protein